MGKLVLFLQDGTTKAIALRKERMVIGRRADNDVCLPYPAVSGEHAAVVTILADSFLEDLGSTNGTLVNGAVVQKHFLRDRDQVDIGQQKLVYLADETAHLEDLNINVVRKEIQTFGEKVARIEQTRRVHDAASSVDAELARDVMREHLPQLPTPAAADAPAAMPDAPLPAIATALAAAEALAPKPEPRHARAPLQTAARAERAAADRIAIEATRSIGSVTPSRDDPLGERASTDRGLDTMARLRAGEAPIARVPGAEPAVENGGVRTASVPEARALSARITVLSGASAGRSLIIESDQIVVGRVGMQVAAIERTPAGFCLRPREGDAAPLLNGVPLTAAGAALASGDVFEVAGARVEFIATK
ncbi:MAG: FHA domain-containing protein [Casimicrobiaceae bacterium]